MVTHGQILLYVFFSFFKHHAVESVGGIRRTMMMKRDTDTQIKYKILREKKWKEKNPKQIEEEK